MKDKITADAWKSILPKGVFASFGTLEGDMPALHISEKLSIGGVNNNRMREFAFGRLHARIALESMGIYADNIPKNKKTGAPVWPKGIIGSITHVNKVNISHVAVAVASFKEYKMLGIDAEHFDQLHPSIWSQFLTEQEFALVASVPLIQKNSLVKKIWALKEAAIKATGLGNMMSWYVTATKSAEKFILSSISEDNKTKLYGKAIIDKNFVLALVYAFH